MKNSNICKFVIYEQKEALSVSCFVLETDPCVMSEKIRLPSHRMSLITAGEGDFFFNGTKIHFSAGNLIFSFKDEEMNAQIKDGCEYMYLEFEGSRADELLRRFNVNKNNRSFSRSDSLIPLWKESLARADKQNVDLVAESILLYTLSRLSPSCPPRDKLIHKLVEILEERFNDPELSISSVSEELSYNPKYLSHLFKEQMGMGFSEYLRTLRIKYAVSLFDHGIDSVKNVALLSGFTDPLYFSGVFKKTVGISPKDYINKHLSDPSSEDDMPK